MRRVAFRSVFSFVIFCGLSAVATIATAQAAKFGASSNISVPALTSEIDSDEVAHLTVTGDFNRDGIADIANIVPHAADSSGPDHLVVLLGQTDGAFRTMTSRVLLGPTPRAMVSGDFNNDGIPDLIVGHEDGILTSFLGDGTGGFNSVQEIARLDSAGSIAVADFDKDGILDIAVSDWRMSSVTVLLGAGKGSFRHAWSFPLRMRGTRPHISTADFNGDRIPDLAVIYEQDDGDTFDVMLGNGNGTFTISPERGLARDPNSHCVILN